MKKPRAKKKKIIYNEGAISSGTAYVIFALLLCASMGILMVGNIIPKGKSPTDGQPVVIQGVDTAQSNKGRLQLYYLKGATYTPSPNPTFAVPAAPAGDPNDPLQQLLKKFF